MRLTHYVLVLAGCLSVIPPAAAQIAPAPPLQTGNISGTVLDTQNDVVSGATVILDGPAPGIPRTVRSSDTGAFVFNDVAPGGPYRVSVRAAGFALWNSQAMSLGVGQFVVLPAVRLMLSGGTSSVVVYGSSRQIATQQVNVEEQQRVLGIIPNFYVVYNPDPAPLTTKLKFSLALHAEKDPVTFVGAALLSGMDQAGDTPNYRQGAKGFGERMGANYTTGFTDIMVGGAILPSLLHQDPRYFYQGTGTTRSRLLHALSAPFICKGDNGHWQPNYSSVGGDLAAGAVAETYYPASNRGPGLVFQSAMITTGGRMANAVIQEFVLKGLTKGGKGRRR